MPCGLHGFCAFDWEGFGPRGETPSCQRASNYHGAQCNMLHGSSTEPGTFTGASLNKVRSDGFNCLNRFTGRGACVLGTCACDAGYWGLDCSATQSFGPDGRAAWVNAHQAEITSSLVHRILFYVVELAAEYITHQVYYSRARWSQDYGRMDSMMFIER